MKHRKKIALSATALGVLTATAIAWGVTENLPGENPIGSDQRFENRWGHRHGGPMGRLTRHLNLSDEQRAEIQLIMSNSRTESEALRARLHDMRTQLGDMVRESGYYEDQVRVLVESNASAFVDLTVLGVRTMSEIYAVLTPEQQAQADELLAGRRGGFGWRGRMGF